MELMFWDGGGEQCEQFEISWVLEPSRSSLEMPKHDRMSPKGYEQWGDIAWYVPCRAEKAPEELSVDGTIQMAEGHGRSH